MSSEKENKKNVVVVGGGFSGANVARSLSSKLDPQKHTLTLVTARPFLLNLTASIRFNTSPDGTAEDNVIITYDKLFLKKDVGTVKVGTVTAIEAGEGADPGLVVLEDGATVPYDVLCLAPGNQWSGPIDIPNTTDEMHAHVESWRNKFKEAKNIVIVGGGAVGIEFAGETRDFFPDKNVTIVHKEGLLINDFFPNKFRKAIEKSVRSVGTNLILGDSVDNFELENHTVTTKSGKKIDADLVVPAFGGKPATGFVASSFGADALADSGRIKVTKMLQLPTHPNIFAAGDAVDTNESKQVFPAYAQAAVVVMNVMSLLDGKEAKKVYSNTISSICISNGRRRGQMYIGILWGIVLGDYIASMIKNFLFGYTKTQYGQ